MITIPSIRLLAQVGEGGMSTVWKAWDEQHDRAVAVKILNREYSASGTDIRNFRTEERLLEKIRHSGVVRGYDFGNADGQWYSVMEFVDGYTFGDLLKRKQHVNETDCLLICESVASALSSAWHDHGIVHCDLKPENIMINTAGEVKLTDLGISHQFEHLEGPQDIPEHVLGTPAYISPEQVYGDVELDCRSDIYSLAATLYHLATGRVLFPKLSNDDMMRAHCDESMQARDPRAYRPELSLGFCQLLESMLVKNRNYRLPTWEEVCAGCQAVEAGGVFAPRETSAASSIKLL